MSEQTIQTSIIKYLKSEGYYVNKTGQCSVSGWPDIVAISPSGSHIYLEVKTPTGRLSPIQREVHARLRSRDVKVYTVRSLQEAKQCLEKN